MKNTFKAYLKKDLSCLFGSMRLYVLICVLYTFLFSVSALTMLLPNSILVTGILLMALFLLEEKNGNIYLLCTLPAPRRQYVQAKFLSALILIVFNVVLTPLFGALAVLITQKVPPIYFSLSFFFLLSALCLFFLEAMFLIILRRGAQKTRVWLLVLFLVFFLGTGIPGHQIEVLGWGKDTPISVGICAVIFVLALLGFYWTYRRSIHLVETRQFDQPDPVKD